MDRDENNLSILVIGVGNRLRGDDAAGPCVADAIRERASGAIRVIDHSGEGASLMELWREHDIVFLADAAQSGAEAGTVHEIDAHKQPVPSEFLRYSTHAFSVAEAIEMARVLDRLPARLYLYAIEARAFAAGSEMSPEVADAVRQVAERITVQIDKLTIDNGAGQMPCTSSAS